MTALNPLYDPATDNLPVDPAVQARMNQTMVDPSGFDPEDQAFLNRILEKVENGSIQLYRADSLLNTSVYERLSPELKAKADQNALVMLGQIRTLVDFMKANSEPTYEVKNMVEVLHETKKRLESEADLFVI